MELNQLGIRDFDAYGVMWYGHYVAWLRRAVPRGARLCHLRYHAPLRWGGPTPTLVVDAVDNHRLLATIRVDGTRCAEALFECDHDLAVGGPPPNVRALVAGRTVPSPSLGSFATRFEGYGEPLTETVALDWFEQSRTRFLGGPPKLAALSAAGCSVLVVQLDDLTTPTPAAVSREAPYECRTTFAHQGWTVCAFRQELWEGGTLRCAMNCKLVFFDRAKRRPVPLPADVRALLLKRQ